MPKPSRLPREAPEPQPTVTVTETVDVDPSDELLAELDARAQELDQREADLDAYAEELTDREAAIEQTELDVTEGTIPGDGIFLVGEDIESGTTEATSTAAAAIGLVCPEPAATSTT
jgi:hypothetical protein